MYDDYSSTWGSDAEKTFGLFYDPVDNKTQDGVVIKDLAEPKPGAYAYQEVAGGSGSLSVYQDFLKGDYVTKLVMHRGYSTKARENTIESFTLAANEPNIYGIETDVYLTKDNKAVCIHDDNTKRVTLNRYNVNVNDVTFDELRNIRLVDIQGNPDVHLIPSLSEYLDIIKSSNKVGFIELKENFSKDELNLLMDEIKSKVSLDKIQIISFHKDALKTLRGLYSDLKIMLLVNNYSEVSLEELKQYNFGLDIAYNGISDSQIEEVQFSNIELNVWTVDDLVSAHKFGRKGVTYLTTNCLTSFKG
jgi:glycerophosphoryl diester phosphodiesterase